MPKNIKPTTLKSLNKTCSSIDRNLDTFLKLFRTTTIKRRKQQKMSTFGEKKTTHTVTAVFDKNAIIARVNHPLVAPSVKGYEISQVQISSVSTMYALQHPLVLNMIQIVAGVSNQCAIVIPAGTYQNLNVLLAMVIDLIAASTVVTPFSAVSRKWTYNISTEFQWTVPANNRIENMEQLNLIKDLFGLVQNIHVTDSTASGEVITWNVSGQSDAIPTDLNPYLNYKIGYAPSTYDATYANFAAANTFDSTLLSNPATLPKPIIEYTAQNSSVITFNPQYKDSTPLSTDLDMKYLMLVIEQTNGNPGGMQNKVVVQLTLQCLN